MQLLDVRRQKHVLATATVQHDGHFKIENLKPGRYMLAGSADQLIPAYVEIMVKKPLAKMNLNSILLITLAADAREECGGSSIVLHSRKNVDRILSKAKRYDRLNSSQ